MTHPDDPMPDDPMQSPMQDASTPTTDAPHVASVLKLAAGMQRHAAILTVVVGVVAVVLGFVLAGVQGGIGAIVGAVIAGGLGWLGTFVMIKTARATPAGVMVGAMTAFAGKIAFLLVFLLLFQGTTLFDSQAFAYTMFAVTAAWIIGEVVGFVRTRIPAVDL
jgi:ATP synthase protein I